MEENLTNTPTQEENPGSISFSGGVNNEYITRFAADPQYERTLEEIEALENSPYVSVLDEETRERFRAQARRRREESAAEDGPRISADPVLLNGSAPDPGWRIGGGSPYVDPLAEEEPQDAPQALVIPPAPVPAESVSVGYIQPLADEYDAPPAPAPAAQRPQRGLAKLVSAHTGFSVYTLLSGAVFILWNALYIAGVVARSVKFDAAERMLLLQGVRTYTVTFDWPVLPVLKAFMYLLPLLALIWALLFKKADNAKNYYNKKTIVVYLCLIVLAMVLAVIDLAALHLVV